MLTLCATENIRIDTSKGTLTYKPGQTLRTDDIYFAVKLHRSGKAKFDKATDMAEIMQELLRIDLQTHSSLFINERIHCSAAIIAAYQAGDRARFIENAVALVTWYEKCQKHVEEGHI